jgi:hypothetical protein
MFEEPAAAPSHEPPHLESERASMSSGQAALAIGSVAGAGASSTRMAHSAHSNASSVLSTVAGPSHHGHSSRIIWQLPWCVRIDACDDDVRS